MIQLYVRILTYNVKSLMKQVTSMNKKLGLPLPFYFVIIMVFFETFFLLELGILKPILNRIREKGRYVKYVEVC